MEQHASLYARHRGHIGGQPSKSYDEVNMEEPSVRIYIGKVCISVPQLIDWVNDGCVLYTSDAADK